MFTSRDGIYLRRNLPPGTYRVIAEFSGFKTAVKENVEVRAGRSTRVDFTLYVQSSSETLDSARLVIDPPNENDG